MCIVQNLVVMEKKCFKCGFIKPLDEFYKHSHMADGHLNKCKKCTKKDVRELISWLCHDPEWRIKERVRGREKYHRLYSGNGSSGAQEAKYVYIRRNPLKRLAHQMVSNAIRDGRLIKDYCEVCGEEAQSHHDDYSKPLEVRWLCVKHHNDCHVKLRELEVYGLERRETKVA